MVLARILSRVNVERGGFFRSLSSLIEGLNDLTSNFKLNPSSNTDIPSPSSSSNSSNPPSSSHQHHHHPNSHHQTRRHGEGGDPTRKREMRLQKNRFDFFILSPSNSFFLFSEKPHVNVVVRKRNILNV